jgi:hypothetical protein
MARKIVDGKAVVSAKELADFKAKHGSNMELRDLLNAERGLTRKPPEGTKFSETGGRYDRPPPVSSDRDESGGKSTVDRQNAMAARSRTNASVSSDPDGSGGKSTVDRQNAMAAQARANASKKEQDEGDASIKQEAPKPRARSLVDQGRGVQLYKDVDKEAVLNTGLGLASLYPASAGVRAAYTAARPAIGAAAKYFSKKDSPAASVSDDIKDPPFNLEKMISRDRPEPMKKGGAIKKMAFGGKASASSRGDGIAQRGKTKGRMC